MYNWGKVLNVSMFLPGVMPLAHYGRTKRIVGWLIKI